MNSDNTRIVFNKNIEFNTGTVIYWMSREQRIDQNWALIYSQELAKSTNSNLIIVFGLVEEFLDALDRNLKFMIDGLKLVKEKANKLNIPFALLKGNPSEQIINFSKNFENSIIITDFDPLKIKRKWQNEVINEYLGNLLIIDGHNIVPYKIASERQEFAAHTIRPKILKNLDNYLTDFPEIDYHQLNDAGFYYKFNSADFPNLKPVDEISWLMPGEDFAKRVFNEFIDEKFNNYAELKNKPKFDVLSNLSPYLHFGHISSQYVAYKIKYITIDSENKDSFLEELIIRKELADNFCFYNENYDNYDGFPNWAKITLSKHLKDKRAYNYSLEILESGITHDKLWNFAQNQMVREGKMHGYLRMYWAKKILEWSQTPEIAMKNTIYLNNKYELDGRDPNGYAGIAWSIGGVHDRPWNERAIFGTVRFMSYNSQIKKVDFDEKTGYFK